MLRVLKFSEMRVRFPKPRARRCALRARMDAPKLSRHNWRKCIGNRTASLFANGILYNHESPRRGENFVTRKIARAAARIARNLETELVLGNIESQRDWGRAEDYVHAMRLMLQYHTADDYVVATGESPSVRDFVEAALAVVDLPWQKYVKHDPAFDRPTEPARLAGCADKIRKKLGWKPAGTFRELVREMVETELDAIDSRD